MMAWAAAIGTVLVSSLLPAWFLLVGCMPPLMVLTDHVPVLLPLGRIGDADFHVHDAVFLVAATKVALKAIRVPAWDRLQPVHMTVGIYMGVLLFATIVSALTFGSQFMVVQLVSYARWVVQVSIVVLLLYSIGAPRTVRMMDTILLAYGYVAAGWIYAGTLLHEVMGLSAGEVQTTGDLVRAFGPLGDQVGYLLVFFAVREAMSGRIVGIAFFVFAVLLTATRGAVIALAVAWAVALYVGGGLSTRSGQAVAFAAAGTVVLAMMTAAGQQLLMRFTDADIWADGYSQRVVSVTLGMRMFLDHWLIGVGFTGFAQLVWVYEPESMFWRFSENYVSNTTNQYVQVATDAGLVGLLAFLLMAVAMVRVFSDAKTSCGLREGRLFNAAQIWLVALLVGNQSAVWLLPGSILSYLLWILVGAAAWSVGFARHESGRAPPQESILHREPQEALRSLSASRLARS